MKSKVVIVATIIGSLLLMPIAGFAESDVDECKKLSGEAAVAIAKREEWNADVAVSQMKKKCAHIQHYAEMAVFYQGKIDRDLRSPATPSAVAEVPVMRRGAGSGTSIIADAAARTSRGESVDLPLPTVAESNDSADWLGIAAQVAQAAAQQNTQRQHAKALAEQQALRQQQIAQAQQTMPNQPSPQASYQQQSSNSQPPGRTQADERGEVNDYQRRAGTQMNQSGSSSSSRPNQGAVKSYKDPNDPSKDCVVPTGMRNSSFTTWVNLTFENSCARDFILRVWFDGDSAQTAGIRKKMSFGCNKAKQSCGSYKYQVE